LVNIFGQFPLSSLNALIGPDEVREAQKRFYREYEIGTAAKVIGVDVARFGDDKSVIAKEAGDTDVSLPPCAQRRFDDWRGLGDERGERVGRSRDVRRRHGRLWLGVDRPDAGPRAGADWDTLRL
jgi:hypothetical protein